MATPARPLSVTVVTPFGSDGGGAEGWLLSLVAHVSADALRFRVIVLQHGPLTNALRELGCEVAEIPVGAGAVDIARASRGILADFRAHRPDVVVGNGVKAQAALIGPARLLRLPTVWIKHDHSFDATLARPLGRLATSVVATAEELGATVGRADTLTIEPARPETPLPGELARCALADLGHTVEVGSPTLAIVGRLVPYKGVDIGISALAYEPARDWHLAVIGPDDPATPGETERLTALAHSLRVTDRVKFFGPLANAGRYLGAFSALAVLTRPGQARAPQKEGYGITATEAMLAGIPVVAAGEGAIARRLVTASGRAGCIVRPGDPRDTAFALGQLSDPAQRVRLGQRGQVVATTAPNAHQVAQAVTRVLQEVP